MDPEMYTFENESNCLRLFFPIEFSFLLLKIVSFFLTFRLAASSEGKAFPSDEDARRNVRKKTIFSEIVLVEVCADAKFFFFF